MTSADSQEIKPWPGQSLTAFDQARLELQWSPGKHSRGVPPPKKKFAGLLCGEIFKKISSQNGALWCTLY